MHEAFRPTRATNAGRPKLDDEGCRYPPALSAWRALLIFDCNAAALACAAVSCVVSEPTAALAEASCDFSDAICESQFGSHAGW